MENTKNIVTISPNEGRTVSIACGNYRIVISGKDTGGEFSMIEMSPPLLISKGWQRCVGVPTRTALEMS